MKSILIIGTRDGGKSTTITEICKMLKPSKVHSLNLTEKKLKTADVKDIYNNTFIIEVKGKLILVVAGAPTEQQVTLKVIIEICLEINLEISFLIVAKRTSERINGFNTLNDINEFSQLLHTERVNLIELTDKNDLESFKQNQLWINRIEKLTKIVQDNI